MVELEGIEFVNFFNIAYQHIELAGQGLVIVQGENGSGKSAMFVEGPFYALYGESFRYGSRPGASVIRGEYVGGKWVRKKKFAVRLTLTDGKNQYLISRAKGLAKEGVPNGLHVECNGKALTRGTMADTQELINDRIIALTPDAAKNSVFYTSEVMSFPTLADSKKKAILDDLLQMGALELALDSTRQILKPLRERVTVLHNRIEMHEQRISKDGAALKEVEEAEAGWKGEHAARVEEAQNKRLEAQKLKQVAAGRTEKHQKRIEAGEAKVEEILEPLTVAEKKRHDLDAEVAEHVKEWEFQKREADTAVHRASALLEKVRNSTEESTCPTCGQRIAGDDPAEKAKAIEHAEKELESAKAAREALVPSHDLSAEKAALGKLSNEVARLREESENWRATVEELRSEQAGMVKEAQEAEQQEKALAAQIAEMVKAANPHTATVAQLTKSVADAQASLVADTAELDQKEQEIRDEETIEMCVGLKGCRLNMLDLALPALNQKAEYLRRILNTDMQVRFKLQQEGESNAGTLATVVTNPNGADSYKGDSRGEQRRADLILLFSLLSLASSRGIRSIRQGFFDEAFESLDPEGQSSVVSMLRDMSEDRSSIFSIAHTAPDVVTSADKVWSVKDGALFT